MYIKSYQCKRFAGLRDVEIEFDKGLNVILGPNESGKSTIVDGIHSTLFKDIRIRKNNNLDREFSFKFMPKPTGDFIDGKVVLKTKEGSLHISKEWGSNESIQMITPQGHILRDEQDIKEELGWQLSFGESTYSNIVFAKQRELKDALSNIIENNEITQEINHILRMTLMELDGISIDSIEKNIEEEIASLYKRWDRDRNYPENNRGINNPYKVGLGKIIESYYAKENLKRDMENADLLEKEFETITINMKEYEDKKKKITEEKSQLEAIEDDVNSRNILNIEIESLKKDMEELARVNREWPKGEQILEQLDIKLKELLVKKEELQDERKNLDKVKRKEFLEKKVKGTEDIEEKLKIIRDEISQIPSIRDRDIENLSQLQNEILTHKTAIEAGKIIGRFKSKTGKPIHISKDLREIEVVEKEGEFQANGFIKINYGDELEIEIETGEVDFKKLNKRYREVNEEFEKALKELGIESIESAKSNLDNIKSKESDIKTLERELELILDDRTIEEINSELEGLEGVKISRDLEQIAEELEKISDEEIDAKSKRNSKMEEIESWEEEYGDHDSLLDVMIGKKTDLKAKEKEFQELKPLPEEFETVEDFKDRLAYLKEEFNNTQEQLGELQSNYYEAKNQLPDESHEELKKQYLEAEKIFQRNINKGEKLLKIYKVFLETKERLSKNPMESLVDEFIRLLSNITEGRYGTGHIDEEFNLRLENPNGEIPIELLSAGTYDSVALALRFSLLKHIFKDGKGYLILDDCLVDLDPERKIQAVDLIKEFSKEYQVIFTTCDPDTANMLSDNIIKIDYGS